MVVWPTYVHMYVIITSHGIHQIIIYVCNTFYFPMCKYTVLYEVSYWDKRHNSLVVSIIVPVAIVMTPAIVPGPSEAGTFKFIVNISFPSTMSSFISVMFIVVLMFPAAITAMCVVELKSMSLPFNEISGEQVDIF